MDYRGYRARRGLARKHHSPRRSDIVRAIPPGSRRLRGHQIERQFTAAMTAHPAWLELRGDARDSMLAYARQLARRADYETGTTRPTRLLLCRETERSASTWKACRRRLEAWGLLGTVSPGRKYWHGTPGGEFVETRCDAAVYVLCAPGRRLRRQAALSPPQLTRPPTCLRQEARISPRARGPEKGQKGARSARPHPAGRPPGGVVAAVLRKGPGKPLTDGWVSHLAGPFLAAGWTAGDLGWAVDHAPDGAQYPYLLENVRDPAAWLRWRLAQWLRPGERGLVDGGDVAWKHARPAPSVSQIRAAAAERARADADRIRADQVAAAAAWTDPRPWVDRILRATGLKRPGPPERKGSP